MVLEAAKQTATTNREISGYQLQDVTISNPILIPDEGSSPEAQLYLRPLPNTFDKNCPSSEFRLCIVDNNDHWKDICKGVIMVEYHDTKPELHNNYEVKARQEISKSKFDDMAKECNRTVDKDNYYGVLRNMGFQFGPTFRSLNKMFWNGGSDAVAEVETFAWAADTDQDFISPHIVHPVTLDAFAQLAWYVYSSPILQT